MRFLKILFILCCCCLAAQAQDTLRQKLNKAKSALDKVNATAKKAAAPARVRKDLKTIHQQVAPLTGKVKVTSDKQTLGKYADTLKKNAGKLSAYKKSLQRSQGNLKQSHNLIQKIIKDSVLAVSKTDSVNRPAIAAQLAALNERLRLTDNSVSIGLDTVNRLLADVSQAFAQINSLETMVDHKISPPAPSKFRQEATYIWSAPKENGKTSITGNIGNTYAWQDLVLEKFLNSTWGDRLLAMLFGVLFFSWVFFNYRKALLPDAKVGELHFRHITAVPVTGAIIVMLILSPLCQPDAPFQYMEVVHLLLLIALSVFFWRRLPGHELRYWLFMVFLFLVIEVTTAAVHDSLFLRLWFVLLNLSSIYFGYVFSRKLLAEEVHPRLIRPVMLIYLALNILAVLANVFGRMSLAKSFTGTAIIGITEVIGLAVFVQLFTDALELQIKLSACSGGLFSRIDIPSARLTFKKVLSGLSVIIWLLVFLINLGVSQPVWDFISQLLDDKRSLGSLNFTIGNVLFFSVILYISNILQKNIGVLFGESPSNRFTRRVEHKSSKLTLLRLVVLIAGLLFAVTASGIPLDKLTVVLGALSVGIGLGMQNIVNNFVSGIILIFEKPFQIGDYVELADKKGKIQDIGIRASRMLTQQGAEVVIPNGDLIANRFTNWTIDSAYVQSEIVLKVSIASDLEIVSKIVKEEMAKSNVLVKTEQPEILVNSITADTAELRILIWISSVFEEAGFKNQLFRALMVRFPKEGIKLM
ncbi:mechanosensitive ion channel domain-containing protein [Mucilaginibacter sp. CAU 1740]|uniref:mechanosensitive ion channel domain-containing protein n=1 Tax=Mucilaginibacter sp. CAU 1740 TaxID=3140365 RepID=UPI00325BF879